MSCCRICIDEMKKPVSLPCGHIFCSDCIVKTVQQAPKPFTHLRPCPICRSVFNVAPINLNAVPPNLRPFVTPSIRRVYLNSQTAEEESADVKDEPEASGSSSSASELARLREENHALRNHCGMWRKRAEMHGAANLRLINFARVVRDQAACLARERDDLQRRCQTLKRRIEDNEMDMYSHTAISDFFPKVLSDTQTQSSTRSPDPDSLLFAPPFQLFSRPVESGYSPQHQGTGSPESLSAEADLGSGRPRKRSRTDGELLMPSSAPIPIRNANTEHSQTP